MLEGVEPSEIGVELDLRYATANNICGRPLYRSGEKVLLHRQAMDRLVRAADSAVEEGFMLLVFDAYRPKRVQEALWEKCPDERYVANPYEGGSMHTRGIAVDLTLTKWEKSHWIPLDMGTDFDEMSGRAHWDAFENGLITQEQQENRVKLRGIMKAARFDTIPTEWWHYQMPLIFQEGKEYPLISENAPSPLTHPDLCVSHPPVQRA
ncbi:MAG: D-alanyl-D-alanine dipeptidase [Alphaproteobacteria bacterium]|nr:D-alanyl-D-alanine dipeptidase [Alphaproteobacteria bacterium]MDA7989113.1 D-alanyl-D-alanine dipeptidase [Alphaproteobacteria bacterium]